MFRSKHWLLAGLTALMTIGSAMAQVETTLQRGETKVSAITMGEGSHAIIALHGGNGNDRRYFFIERGGALGQALANAGFLVIAPTWAGQAGAGFHEVQVAIEHARALGASKISLIGHSRGGELAAGYARSQPDDTFNTVIQLNSVDDKGLPLGGTKKLFVYNKYDRFALWQPRAFDASAEPRMKLELGGSGHPVSGLIAEKPDLVDEIVAVLKR